MSKLIDLTGKSFGRLIVISRIEFQSKRREAKWLCNCICGSYTKVLGYHLRNSKVQSCGCLSLENKTIHNHSISKNTINNRTYISWQKLKDRCLNENNDKYEDYGGRGIKVCQRWLDSFENFLLDMGERPLKTSIDRINNDGDYLPENCRWATQKEQSLNKRTNRIINYNGKSKTLSQWSEISNTSPSLISYRIKAGWSTEQALFGK